MVATVVIEARLREGLEPCRRQIRMRATRWISPLGTVVWPATPGCGGRRLTLPPLSAASQVTG